MEIIKEELRPRVKNIVGFTTTRLTVISYVGYKSVLVQSTNKVKKVDYWNCICTCGKSITKTTAALVHHKVKSCGCQKAEVTAARNKTHGKMNTPEYESWRGMKERCTNPNHINWHIYGGKGIKVCKRWVDDLLAFIEDMGNRPKGMSLDRIDSNGDYCPENCRWADTETQAFNTCRTRQLTYKGETLSLAKMAEKHNIGEATLRYRLNQGWSLEVALLTAPKDPKNYGKHAERYQYEGEDLTLKEHAEKFALNINTVRGRINRGFNFERVFSPAKKRNKKKQMVSANIR